MAKRILYLTFIDLQNKKDLGINIKTNCQKKAFEEIGYEVEKTYIDQNLFKINGAGISFKNESKFDKLYNRLSIKKEIIEEVLKFDCDIVYIRFRFINYPFINLIKNLKSQNKKVIIEIPTYPFLSEKSKFDLRKIFHIKGMSLLKNNNKYVDLITYYGEAEETICSIKALKLENCINAKILKTKLREKKSKVINFIAVANISNWHGYDRMLKSIAKLKDKENMKFHVVGVGDSLNKLKTLVEELKINKSVLFYGAKSGAELENIFLKADIGVDSLGRHRSGNNINSSLKSKEYMAYGLPIIKSHIDEPLEGLKYVYNVSANDDGFCLEEILNWYRKSEFDPEEIREYAKVNFDWKIQMEKVIDQIHKKEK